MIEEKEFVEPIVGESRGEGTSDEFVKVDKSSIRSLISFLDEMINEMAEDLNITIDEPDETSPVVQYALAAYEKMKGK